MSKKKSAALFTIAVTESRSYTTAMRALRFLVTYGRLCDEVGEELLIEDYGERVGISRSQAFRRQAAFRKCFPTLEPLYLWHVVEPKVPESAASGDDRSLLSLVAYVGGISISWESER